MIGIVLFGVCVVLAMLMAWQESKKRKISFLLAVVICIAATPLFGYFIISSFASRNPIGCNWCGNRENEAEYCGLCGKNAAGDMKTGFKVRA